MPKVSLSWFQPVVVVTAGLLSIVGGAYSVLQIFRPAGAGEVLAIIHESRSGRPVAAATVEILTTQDALVATLMSPENGRIRQTLKEGSYRLSIKHPDFRDEQRTIQVVSGQTVDVRIALTEGIGGQTTRAVGEGVGAVRRFFRDLGL